MDALKDEVPGGLAEEIQDAAEDLYEAWTEWEYDTEKKNKICIQTSQGKKYVCCDFGGLIECVDKQDFKTVFESVPHEDMSGYVALECIWNGLYLSVDEYGDVKGIKDKFYFNVKSQANDKTMG